MSFSSFFCPAHSHSTAFSSSPLLRHCSYVKTHQEGQLPVTLETSSTMNRTCFSSEWLWGLKHVLPRTLFSENEIVARETGFGFYSPGGVSTMNSKHVEIWGGKGAISAASSIGWQLALNLHDGPYRPPWSRQITEDVLELKANVNSASTCTQASVFLFSSAGIHQITVSQSIPKPSRFFHLYLQ